MASACWLACWYNNSTVCGGGGIIALFFKAFDKHMPSAIEIKAVSKRYGSLQALDDVSINVEPGEFFALLGPNGAGKTTLISAMAGLSRPDSGSIRSWGMMCSVIFVPHA
jgi:ABC-type polysaccharide/polyol phosphate transport system ATPase subunit